MKENELKESVRSFALFCGLSSSLLFLVIYTFFFTLGAGVGILAPLGILCAPLYLKRKPSPWPPVGHSGKSSDNIPLGQRLPEAQRSQPESILQSELAEQRRHLWQINVLLIIVTIGLIYLSYNTSGLFVKIGNTPFDIGGIFIAPQIIRFLRNALVIVMPVLTFFAAGYLSVFVFTVSILRRWDALHLRDRAFTSRS